MPRQEGAGLLAATLFQKRQLTSPWPALGPVVTRQQGNLGNRELSQGAPQPPTKWGSMDKEGDEYRVGNQEEMGGWGMSLENETVLETWRQGQRRDPDSRSSGKPGLTMNLASLSPPV